MTTLVRLVWGDLFERLRRPAWVGALVFFLVAAGFGVPSVDSGYTTVDLDGWRGRYDSAWVGASVALLAALFLSLIGFYLVKNALETDRRTRVGPILASTPLSRFGYLLSKAAANFCLLGTFLAAVFVMAGVMQLVRGESRTLDLVALVTPFLLVTLPLLAVTAAVAVFFESVPLLRGSLGNVAWFFLFIASLAGPSMEGMRPGGRGAPLFADPLGAAFLMGEMRRGAMEMVPGFSGKNTSVGVNIQDRTLQVFDWPGIHWTAEAVAGRLLWFLVAGVIVAMAVPWFDRFAEEGGPGRGAKRSRGAGLGETGGGAAGAVPGSVADASAAFGGSVSLSRLAVPVGGTNLLRLVSAELKLLIRGVNRWWWLAGLGLVVVSVAAPPPAGAIFGAVLWIWPLGLWSSLGCRDRLNGTTELIESSAGSGTTRVIAQWLAGVVLALVVGLGPMIGALIHGAPGGAIGWVAGAAFVSAMAVAGGTLSGGRRLFEGLYVALWYLGPLNHQPAIDYTGLSAVGNGVGSAVPFIILAIALLAVAITRTRTARN